VLDALRLEALTGGATSAWRENHAAEIAEALSVRDSLLRQRVASIATPSPAPLALKDSAASVIDQRVSRKWLFAELSEFQRQLLRAFCEYPEQPLLAEDADIFGRFCDDTAVVDRLQAFGPTIYNRIRRTLSQLAAVGLIAKITLPRQNPLTGEREYVKAFRPLREDEYTRLGDVEALRRALEA
jgi:type I restriction enzyme, S subunit